MDRNAPAWYCSVVDAGHCAVVLGPFSTEAACREWAYRTPEDGGIAWKHSALLSAADRDPRSWFYSWGMVKLPTGQRVGGLNQFLPEALRDMERE